MEVEKLGKSLFALNGMIKNILGQYEYVDNGFKLDIAYDKTSPDDYMMYHTFSDIFTHLDYVNYVLDYLQKPVKLEGIVTISKRGNYRINKTVLKKGQWIEVYKHDEEENLDYWDLVMVGDTHEIEGLQARLRR